MADQQDRPDERPDATRPADAAPPQPDAAPPQPDAGGGAPSPTPPAPPPPAKKKPPAKVAKAAKKTPAKAPKKTPPKAAKTAAPAKKAANKPAPKKSPPQPVQNPAPSLADTNGDRNLTDAAKETAAQAKSAVAAAGSPVTRQPALPLVGPDQSRLPLAAAIAAGVLAILLVLVARRHGDD